MGTAGIHMNPGEQSDLPVEISKGIPTGTRGKKKGPHGIPRESSRTPVVTTTTHGNTRQFPWDTAEIPRTPPRIAGTCTNPRQLCTIPTVFRCFPRSSGVFLGNPLGYPVFPTIFRGIPRESPRAPPIFQGLILTGTHGKSGGGH